jgi:hypothetical protein
MHYAMPTRKQKIYYLVMIIALSAAGAYRFHVNNERAAFVQAVKEGDVAEVRRQLAHGADPSLEFSLTGSAGSPFRFSVLWEALSQGENDRPRHKTNHHDIARMLINAGAKLDAPGVMSLALQESNRDLVPLLIERGARPRVNDLVSAISFGDPAIVSMILEQGVEVNATQTGRGSPLFAVLGAFPARDDATWRRNMTQIAEMLLRSGADPNTMTSRDTVSLDSTNPLLYAVQLGEREIAAALLSHGADANLRTEQGKTPLMEARSVPMARLLIAHGADVNAVDSTGRSALQWAEQHRKQQREESPRDGKRKPEGSGYNSPHYEEVAAFLRQATAHT